MTETGLPLVILIALLGVFIYATLKSRSMTHSDGTFQGSREWTWDENEVDWQWPEKSP